MIEMTYTKTSLVFMIEYMTDSERDSQQELHKPPANSCVDHLLDFVVGAI